MIVADSTMDGSSSREWTSQQIGEALDAGTAVATSSQHLEPHQVGAMLLLVTPVLQLKSVDAQWQQGCPACITGGAQH